LPQATGRTGIKTLTRLLDPAAALLLLRTLHEHESWTAARRAEKMSTLTGRRWSERSIGRALHELGYSHVRVTQRAAEQRPHEVVTFRRRITSMGGVLSSYLFMDETAIVGLGLQPPQAVS
jgi:hypothetical protein